MTRMELTLAAIAAAMIAAPGAAFPEPTKKTETVEVKKVVRIVDGKEVAGGDREVERLAASCSARSFETTAELDKNGQKQRTKIKLCAKDGETDAQWKATLKDALKRLDGMTDLAPESRTKIAADLNAEIARVDQAK